MSVHRDCLRVTKRVIASLCGVMLGGCIRLSTPPRQPHDHLSRTTGDRRYSTSCLFSDRPLAVAAAAARTILAHLTTPYDIYVKCSRMVGKGGSYALLSRVFIRISCRSYRTTNGGNARDSAATAPNHRRKNKLACACGLV